jgi:hypothetical protein
MGEARKILKIATDLHSNVLLVYFREKSRGYIESSQILNSKNSNKFAFNLHFYSKKLKHFYYFFDGNAIYIFF